LGLFNVLLIKCILIDFLGLFNVLLIKCILIDLRFQNVFLT